MTLFDYVVLFIIALSVLIGALRGLVREIVSLAGWIVAFIVANLWASSLAPLLPEQIPGQNVKLIVAFAILFIGVLLLTTLVGVALALIVRAARLTFIDRTLGLAFGVLRGGIMVLTVVILAGFTALPQQPVWRDSIGAPYAEAAVRALKPMLPPAWASYIHY